jgi:leucyl-tRNA synthetase
MMVPPTADAAALEKLALADPKVQELIAGKTIVKVIAVPSRLVNLVVK